MRVLLAADLHYDLRKFDWVLARAGDPTAPVDVVVLAGDLLDIASAVPIDVQITVVLGYLERFAAVGHTLVCSGNHDLDHRTESGEKATGWLAAARHFGVHVDGDSFDLDGWRLTACAWWEGPLTLADLEVRLASAATDRPSRWLWAFHGPPEGPLSWTGARHYGDPELPRLLAQHRPDVVLCGHVHQAPFTSAGSWVEHRDATWLFNVGYQRGRQPAFIDLDLGRHRASWWSIAGCGEVDLGDPATVALARQRQESGDRSEPGSMSTGG